MTTERTEIAAATPETAPGHSGDWEAVMQALDRGEPEAIERLTQVVHRVLGRCGARDFRGEWEDLVQDVLMALLIGVREGRIREPAAFVGYAKRIATNKWNDRLARHVRCREDAATPIEDLGAGDSLRVSTGRPESDDVIDVRRALAKLPRHKAEVVYKVYAEGKSYGEAARETNTPFGSLKRHLREGMELLRAELAVAGG